MNKWFNRMIAMILCVCIMIGSAGSARAAEDTSENETQDTREGVVLPDIDDSDDGVRKTLYFQMSNISVNGSSVKFSSTSFTKGSLLNADAGATKIYVIGLLYHSATDSYSPNQYIRTGLCYYDSNSGTYLPAFYFTATSGRTINEPLVSVSNLTSTSRYKGFVRNLSTTGVITGSVGFYYSIE